MRRKLYPILASCMLILAILSCNLPSAQGPSPTDLAGTITAQASTLEVPSVIPTPTSTPTITPTVTPSVPTVVVSTATNCRSGPGTDYDLVSTLGPGQSAQVVGKYSITNYWIIDNPTGGTCWLWGQYATVSGNIGGLPELVPPPSPTPALPAAPVNLNVDFTCTLVSTPIFENKVHVDLSWTDVATNEDGYRVYRDGTQLATLAANATSFSDDTTMAGLVITGSTPPTITYAIEAFNAAGNSQQIEKSVSCFK